jgi:DNA-binding PadR family transcriptional regulator
LARQSVEAEGGRAISMNNWKEVEKGVYVYRGRFKPIATLTKDVRIKIELFLAKYPKSDLDEISEGIGEETNVVSQEILKMEEEGILEVEYVKPGSALSYSVFSLTEKGAKEVVDYLVDYMIKHNLKPQALEGFDACKEVKAGRNRFGN